MTDEQAKKAMPYAPRNVEVLEKLGVDCPECKGLGAVQVIGANLHCDTCDGGRVKIKLKWQPQVGEWWFHANTTQGPRLLTSSDDITELGLYDDATPILDFETIEEILKRAGYMLSIEKHYDGEPPKTLVSYKVSILKSAVIKGKWGDETIIKSWEGKGKSRQRAISLAIDALGKELEGKQKKK